MEKDVMILTGAGQIGMAIARRMGYGKKIVIGDKNPDNAQAVAKIMNDAGYDADAVEMDLSSRESIKNLIAKAQEYGDITMLANAAGVSPSQAPVEAILGGSGQGDQRRRRRSDNLKPVRTSYAGPYAGGRRTACLHARRGPAEAGHSSAGEYQRYAARLSDGETLQ